MTHDLEARTISITGHDGDKIEAYLARPLGPGPFGGVALIHHRPGFDDGMKEKARRFAAEGYIACMPNLYHREAPGASPEVAAAASTARGGVPDERLVGDVDGALRHMGSLPSSNGKVATIGYCSGGRQSFLAACSLKLDAAVDCYGAFVAGTPPEGAGPNMRPIVHMTKDLSCPLLGLFGADDQYPSPAHVAELEKALRSAGKIYEFHSYPGAAHAFFEVDRPSYRPEAAKDAWRRIFDFFGHHLSS
ncbi:MAG TPA: dienelactone hydrolase family protein [Acidimicrobiales bacterium]|nr:dienelactone hydrolase family protein [Acidimicrobiales bacterium]